MKNLWIKYQSFLLYVIFGVLTTIVNIFSASSEHKVYRIALLAVYLCGLYYPVRELTDVMKQDNMAVWQEPYDSYYTLEQYANPRIRELDENLNGCSDDMIWNYYTYDAEESFFMKTIGKRIKQ